ncbi:MAG: hypothetical protein GC151_09715 [Betaproteobacteria bacterium]|nr:hypothetical protein [Betaproteobacteria bacterium]
MRLVSTVFLLASLLAAPAFAADQEETFTIPEAGAPNVDGAKLSTLLGQGDPRAINNIGWLWARGEGGVKQNFQEAMKWFRHAAKMGYTVAMNNVGLLYSRGDGVPRSDEEAFKWWMRSAERGDAWAMTAVGDMYENGAGVPQSYELAFMWYREAAYEGDGLGMWNLGHLSEEGLGTEKDIAKAVEWYRKSAEHGYGPSIYRLGRFYESGSGVAADVVEAYAHYSVAAHRLTAEDAQDAADNARLLEAVTARLTPDQRAAGDARARVLDEAYRKPEPSKSGAGTGSTT